MKKILLLYILSSSFFLLSMDSNPFKTPSPEPDRPTASMIPLLSPKTPQNHPPLILLCMFCHKEVLKQMQLPCCNGWVHQPCLIDLLSKAEVDQWKCPNRVCQKPL